MIATGRLTRGISGRAGVPMLSVSITAVTGEVRVMGRSSQPMAVCQPMSELRR